MSEFDTPPRYCAYLLRCWEAPTRDGAAGSAWRFTMEDAHTGERHAFAGLAALVAFLQAELIAGPAPSSSLQSGARPAPPASAGAGQTTT